jgi:hypothetical protein
MFASYLLEHAACFVADLLVLLAAEGVAGFLLEEIEACRSQLLLREMS